MSRTFAFLGLYAETSLHPGSARDGDVIDREVQRAVHTGLPLIPAPSEKGVLRASARERNPANANTLHALLFGPETRAGTSHGGAFGPIDARLLAFPVQSLQDVFVWITCPMVLACLQRDLAPSGFGSRAAPVPKPTDGEALVGEQSPLRDLLVLSDIEFTCTKDESVGNAPDPGTRFTVADAINQFLPQADEYAYFRDRMHTHLAVISDHWFAHFVRRCTEVVTRNRLNDKKTTTGGGGNVWTQELLPSECVFYAPIAGLQPRGDTTPQGYPTDAHGALVSLAEEALAVQNGAVDSDGPVIQIGGDETVGRGFVRTRWIAPPAAAATPPGKETP